jgi:glycosyltransferase involved in cell wall biosynthesis
MGERKVAFCHNGYQQRSGEDIAFDSAVRLLRESGNEVAVYSRSNAEIQEFSTFDKLLFPANTIYSFRTRREIRRFLEREKPSVAVAQNVFPLLSPSIYYELAEQNIPIVQLFFNYRPLCANGLFFTKGQICERCSRGNYLHGIINRCFRDSYSLSAIYAASLSLHRVLGTWKNCIAYFVTPDRFLKSKLAGAGFPEERIRVISNPFDATEYVPDFEEGQYALFVGRLIRPKGIFTLLDAAQQVDVPLVIAGDGEEAEAVRTHPAILSGRAKFLGPVYGERLHQLLGSAAFTAVPSEWYDNLPMIVCQAFASGKPVIASRINGIPEFIMHEENGLLFAPGQSGELAAAMLRLWNDAALRKKLGRGARQTAETVLSPRVWQERMNNLLQEAVVANPLRHTT